MSKAYEEDLYMGEIGSNLPLDIVEREENFLKTLYLWWKNNKPLLVVDLMIELGVKRREITTLAKKMVKHGYLKETDESGELFLTDFGKTQGAECLLHHQMLTQFLQMVSGMDEQEVEQEACRLEHVISSKSIEGIGNFLKYGDVYDRVMHNFDLHAIFERGIYAICMALYRPDQRSPRVLAEEFTWFADESRLEIEKAGCYAYLQPIVEMGQKQLWYQTQEEWIKAKITRNGYQIPTDIFVFTMSSTVPVTEGTAIIAITEGDTKPGEAECRELNIHLW